MPAPTPTPIVITTPAPATTPSSNKSLAYELIKLILEILNKEGVFTISWIIYLPAIALIFKALPKPASKRSSLLY